MERTNREKREAFRKMLAGPGIHIGPSCNDPLTARLVEWLQFPLVHLSGSSLHRSFGFADAGLLTMNEVTERARVIGGAVDLPLVSDAETGYGGAANVARTIKEFDRAGVAGIHIEDQFTPRRAGHEGYAVNVIPQNEMVDKIRAAVDARRDDAMVIVARSEARQSLQERLDRLSACAEAGADAIWVTAQTVDEIQAYVKTMKKPLMGVAPRRLMTIRQYGDMGVHVGVVPTVTQVAALHAIRQVLEELKKSGTEAGYFEKTEGIEETRKWYAEQGNRELKDLERKLSAK